MDSPKRDSDDLNEVLLKLDATIRRVPERPKGTFTSSEFAAAAGVSMASATRKIKANIRAGVLEFAGKVQCVSMIGALAHVPAYRLKKSCPTDHRPSQKPRHACSP